MKTIVKFVKFKTEIVALFPNEIADSKGNILSYAHNGQHGPTSKSLMRLRYAQPKEFEALRKELTNLIGYNLQIMCPKKGVQS